MNKPFLIRSQSICLENTIIYESINEYYVSQKEIVLDVNLTNATEFFIGLKNFIFVYRLYYCFNLYVCLRVSVLPASVP